MSLRRPATRAYVRPMHGWWRRSPHFRRYMLREASALFLLVYTLELLVGLWRLGQGEAAFEAWRAGLAAPAVVAFHMLTLAMLAYHSITWFQVMPKTAPDLRRIPPGWITAAGLGLAAGLWVAMGAGVWWLAR